MASPASWRTRTRRTSTRADGSAKTRSIPESSLRRLPLYHRLLEQLQRQGRKSVSCPEIGAELKLDPTQVRKDLEAAGIAGLIGLLCGVVWIAWHLLVR